MVGASVGSIPRDNYYYLCDLDSINKCTVCIPDLLVQLLENELVKKLERRLVQRLEELWEKVMVNLKDVLWEEVMGDL